MRRLVGLTLLSALWIGTGCTDDTPSTPSVQHRDSAGIEIVSHPASDRPLTWSFEQRFTLGSAISGPDQFHQVDDHSVAFDSLGHLFVLDRGNARILVFDRSGEHLRTFGSEGRGPDQLSNPVTLWLDGNEVRVLDWARGAIVRYGRDGSTLDDLSTDVWGMGQRVHRSGEGLVYSREDELRSTADSVTERVLFVQESDTVVLEELRKPAPASMGFEGCPPRFSIDLEPIFNPGIVWSASPSIVATHPYLDYRVDLFEGSRRFLSLRRRLPPIRVSEEDALAEARDLPGVRVGETSCRFDPEEQVRKRGYARFLQPIREIGVAWNGNVWIQRNAPGDEPGPIDVFSAEGGYLGTLDEDIPFPAAFGPERTFVARHVDDLDVVHFTVYQIRTGDDEE